MLSRPLRVGTRSSPMALAQTYLVRDRLAAFHPELTQPGAIEIVSVTTVADKVLDRPLSAIGGKGLFTKELELSLLRGEIDIAVHSMKDVETWLPDGLQIGCILPRDDPREAFLSPLADRIAELPSGSTVGTSSLRRSAQVLMARPDLRVTPLRGNANTRLRKLAEAACDATLLAVCGLLRLGLESRAKSVLSTDEMLPSAGQGALGVECRRGDRDVMDYLAPLACPVTTACLGAERSLLAALDGSCRTPIAALAEVTDEILLLRGMLFTPDGRLHWSTQRQGGVGEAAAIGQEAGQELRQAGGTIYEAHLR